ncbi:hypothetical protein [Falsiroseomonas selenitidurans]|uniref:Uncharacterized protein n=1 Tax=Falsiroseomonas selenitidurans TaxID=2716335 RepID=A0ABX1E219_9PROT|nr:hypothetical protein [Falsiroseomonas selenitidurans]NKC31194.1 hypothetical protein [Falsiroseomonas selenitidurans]
MGDTTPPAAPTLETMTVENWEILGNLVKSWSTQDSIYTNGTLHPVPRTIEELRDLLVALGAGPNIPAHVDTLTVVHYRANEMVLRIPPADLIRAKEARLTQPGSTYGLPDFYEPDPIDGTQEEATPEQKLRLQARRIGDYTIAHCE